METFYKNVIPKSGLPKDFGGDLASVEELHEKFKNEYYGLGEYFRAEEAQRGSCWDEKGSNKKKKNNVDKKQIIQNFQKLDID